MSNQTISPGALLAGRYRIAELLSEIDGARAWRATDEVLGRSVVLDVLGSDDPRSARLHDAARRAAAAADSRFLRVLDCDVVDGLTYCVREFAGGRPLERMLGGGPITGQQAGWLTREVSEALENLHRTGLHHGAISPATVIITDTGSVKVLGVATEAVLHSLGPGSPENDVRDLGTVLYASLTARWPGGPAYGLQAAPVEHGRLLSPRQVRAGVPRSLDDITDRLVGNPPRHHATPLTSAAGLSAALSGVIGRSHEPPSQISDETVAVAQLNGSVDDAATVMVPIVEEPPALDPPNPHMRRPNLNGAPPRQLQDASYAASQSTRPVRRQPPASGGRDLDRHGNGGRRQNRSGRAPKEERGGGWGGRILILLAILALLSVIAMAQFLAKGAFRDDQKDKDEPKSAATPLPASKAVKIVNGQDFDPKPKGNGEEHPEDVRNTYDGKQDTTWKTMRYFDRIAKVKSGVGIVYDLGAVTDVSQVSVQLKGEPYTIELRTPTDPATSPAKLDGWDVVATAEDASDVAVLKPSATAKTRYLLIWLTDVPKASGGYVGEIAEVTVQR